MDFASCLRHAVDINLPSTIYGESLSRIRFGRPGGEDICAKLMTLDLSIKMVFCVLSLLRSLTKLHTLIFYNNVIPSGFFH